MAKQYAGISNHKGETSGIFICKGHPECVQAVITPGRMEKRQNGRRIKGPGEPGFTLTCQVVALSASPLSFFRKDPVCPRRIGIQHIKLHLPPRLPPFSGLSHILHIRRWGFAYKTLGFCWVKRCRKQTDKWFWGLGFWTRANPEMCLIATRR